MHLSSETPEPAPPAGAGASGNSAVLRGDLGIGSILFMVVAAAAPLGVVAGQLPFVFSVANSPGAPIYFALAGAILLVFAVGFCAMSKYIPNAGAFYSYVLAGLGRPAGLGAASLAIGSYGALLIACYPFAGSTTSKIISHFFGVDVQWWICTIVVVLITGALGYRNIELSAKVLGVVLVLEATIVVVMDIAVIARGGETGLSLEPMSWDGFFAGSPALGLVFAFLGFIGFEATAVFRSEAKDPERTVPRATYIAVVSIAIFYTFAAWAVVQGVGLANVVQASVDDPQNLVLNVAGKYIAPIFSDVMLVLLLGSQFATILAFHNVLTRYQFTLAGKGLLPRRWGEVHPKHGAPSSSSLSITMFSLAAIVLVLVAGLDPLTQAYTWLAGASTIGLIALMALTSLSVMVFFRTKAAGSNILKATVAPSVSFIALASIFMLVMGNLELLIGSTIAGTIVALLITASFVVGVIGAIVTKQLRPDTYAGLQSEYVIAPGGRSHRAPATPQR